jgi:formate dehydrogenase major subunit
MIGQGAMSNSILEIEDAPVLLCVGTNMTESHPVVAVRVKRAVDKGARLIVVDPRRTGLADRAHRFLRLKPGSDAALFNAMAQAIVDAGLVNRAFVEERTEGYAELVEHLRRFTPEAVENETGIPAAEIRAAALEYASAERAGIYYTLGVTEHVGGVANVQSLCNLALLTGNLGRASAGINPLRGQNNVQGSSDAGALPNMYPGYQRVDDSAVRARFEQAWGVPLPSERGITKVRALERVLEGSIRAMWIVGENTVASDADAAHTEKALKALDFLVVQDLFLSETAKLAHVVLPAAAFAEMEGTFTNTERRVQRVRKLIDPPGLARPDWWIIGEVGRRMGGPARLDFPSAADVFDDMAAVSPIYRGLSHARLDAEDGLCWPVPGPEHPGTPVLHAGRFVNGRGVFKRVEPVPIAEQPDSTYPFLLTTGRRLATYHTNTMTGACEGFDVQAPHETVEIHPDDADRLGTRTGDWLRVRSRRGALRVRAKVTDRSPAGMVFMSFAFPETPTNVLTTREGDPTTETPELKAAAVAIERLEEAP